VVSHMFDGVDVQVAPKREIMRNRNELRTEICGIPDRTFAIGGDSLVSNEGLRTRVAKPTYCTLCVLKLAASIKFQTPVLFVTDYEAFKISVMTSKGFFFLQ